MCLGYDTDSSVAVDCDQVESPGLVKRVETTSGGTLRKSFAHADAKSMIDGLYYLSETHKWSQNHVDSMLSICTMP